MKARPRSVERKVAACLSQHFAELQLSPVERIPVLGRTGPDLTINELGLVIDVKSRLEVPKTIFQPSGPVVDFRDELHLVGIRLKDIYLLTEECDTQSLDFSSALIHQWYVHMDEWTQENSPSGITALVLHRPRMPIGAALLILSLENRRRLIQWKIQW
ncbi:MAG: hypothetical protein AAGU17_10745 [Anaerolineaceae bacterium]